MLSDHDEISLEFETIAKEDIRTVLPQRYHNFAKMRTTHATINNKFLQTVSERLCKDIMQGDHMFNNQQAYFEVGASALKVILASISFGNTSQPPKTILDFACGSGRVLRWLKAAWPESSITASDVRDDSLEFCKKTFGVKTIHSTFNFENIKFDQKFDLIWCGSLLTHLDANDSSTLIQMFSQSLAPKGLCVFTTHGRKVVENIITGRNTYGLAAKVSAVLADLALHDYAFTPYAGNPRIGFSVCNLNWIVREVRQTRCRLVCLSEAGWANHQDVSAVQPIEPI